MNIRKTIIVTAAILATVAMVAPSFAGAVTVADLQAQIQALMAQLTQLQGGTTTNTGTGACAGITFTRNLTVGSTGSDVKCLQVLFNNNGYTIAVTGAGSPGNETSYFGAKTLAVVKTFQAANGLTPANQVGPLTRGKLNALLGGTVTPGNPVVTPTGAGLQVMLASDNPASGTIVVGSTLTPLAKYVFVNGDNAAVNITSLKVSRIGVSSDSDLQNVYLLQGATRITDSATVASGVINFNNPSGLFSVPAGSSVEITVAADILGYSTGSSEASAGETIAVSIPSASSITTNASSVKGNYPISGNMMTTAGTYQTLANVAFTTATPSSVATINPQNNYPIWSDSITVNTRTVNLTRIAFRLIGSVQPADLQNFVLNVDGANVGAPVQSMDSNGYVTFNLSSSPLVLQASGHIVKLMANIVNGSSHNFTVSIRVPADAGFVDSQYGANVQPYVSSLGTWTLSTVTTALETIASGTLTVSKAQTSPSGNVVLGASNQPIVDYTVSAAGEPIKITDLYFCINDSGGTVAYFRNGALYANGVQVGSTTNIASDATITCNSSTASSSATHFSLGSALLVTPGSPVTLEVRADIHEVSAPAVANADSIYAELLGSSTYFTAQDMISLATPTVPSTNIAGNTLTVSQGSLSLSKYGAYTNQTVGGLPQTGYKLGEFSLTGSTTEATNLTSIYVDLHDNLTPITNLYVKYGPFGGTMQSTTVTAVPSTTDSTAGNNLYTINNYTLPAGQSLDMQVYGDIGTAFDTDVYPYMAVVGTTASSIKTVYAGGSSSSVQTTAGQKISYSAGAFVGTQDPGTPLNEVLAGGQPVTAGIFQFTAQNDTYTLNELKFSFGSGTSAGSANAANAITSVALKDGNTTVQTQQVQALSNGTGTQYVAYFTGLNLAVPTNTVPGKSLSVVVTLSSSLSSDTHTSNIDVQPYLTYVKASPSSGSPICGPVQTGCTTATAGIISTASVNKTYVFKAVPSITYNGAPQTSTQSSQAELYNVKVGATSNTIKVKQMKFVVSVNNNSAGNPGLYGFTFLKNGTDITSSVAIRNTTTSGTLAVDHDLTSSGTSATTTMGTGTVVVSFNTEDSITAGSTTTYQLKAYVDSHFGKNATSGYADSVTTYMPYDTGNVYTTYPVANGSDYFGGTYINTTKITGVTADTGIYGFDATRGDTLGNGSSATSGANFVWSDNSAGTPYLHDYDASTATVGGKSADWYNSYLIMTSNLNTESVVAQ